MLMSVFDHKYKVNPTIKVVCFYPLITHFLPTFLIRTRPSFSHSQSLQSRSLYKPLNLFTQRVDRMKTTITENWSNWSHGQQPYLTQWNYEPCHVGPSKMDGSWGRVLTKCGPLEKEMANLFNILILRTPWTIWKGKKIGHWKMNSPG